MSIGAELLDHYNEQNRKGLARLLKCRDSSPDAVTLVDNSIPASFVSRRLKRETPFVLDLFQIWNIENAFKEDFLNSLEDGISFPMEARMEYANGLDRLAKVAQDPLKALKTRWSSPNFELPHYVPEINRAAAMELEDFLNSAEMCRGVFRAIPTEAYMDDKTLKTFGKVEETIREIARDLKIRNGEKLRRQGEHNDANIFSAAYALAQSRPVTILTGDRHFLGIQEEVYKNAGLIAASTDTLSPEYPVTVVLDKPQRPWVQRPSAA